MAGRILFVEPDQEVLDVYQSFFARRGFLVYTADNDSGCLNAILRQKPHIVVIEPECVSAKDLHEINHYVTGNNGALLIVTRGRAVSHVPAAISVAGYFVKPVSMWELEKKLVELLPANWPADEAIVQEIAHAHAS